MSVIKNLQAATVATFVDLQSIGGLAVINMGAVGLKSALYPSLPAGMAGAIGVSVMEGAHDLVRYYYMRSSAVMPTNPAGTTSAG